MCESNNKPPVRLDNLLLGELLGQGGMGQVWAATHAPTQQPVAIKVIAPQQVSNEHAISEFFREAHAVARLRHPSILSVYDLGLVSAEAARSSKGRWNIGQPYLIMERAESSLNGRAPRSWRGLKHILTTLLEGLAHAHARGILHRDLKPSNLLRVPLPRQGHRLRIADFGISRLLTPTADSPTNIQGTPGYMAPEQARGDWRSEGPWTDLFGLGSVAWKLATGAAPHAHSTAGELPPFTPRFSVPPELDGWLLSLLASDPAHRTHSAADALHRLRELPHTLSTPASDSTPSVKATGTRTHAVLTPQTLAPALPIPIHPTPRMSRPPLDAIPQHWLPPAASNPRKHAVPEGLGLGLHAMRVPRFSGRKRERTQLWRGLQEVWQLRSPHGIWLTGPSGIGRTQLATWLAETVLAQGLAWVIRSDHPTEGAGLGGPIWHRYRCTDLEGVPAVHRIRQGMAVEGIRKPGLAGALASLGPIETPKRPASPAERVAITLRWLRALGAMRPIVLIVNITTAPDDLLEDVHQLLDAPDDDLPILIVAIDQDNATPPAGPHIAHLPLAPLSKDATTELVNSLLHLSGDLRTSLVDRVGGHPLFVIQLLADWVDRGLLVARDGQFELTEPSPPIPDALKTLVVQRVRSVVERIGPLAATVLEVMACMGPTIRPQEVHSAGRKLGLTEAPALLAQLLDTDLVQPTDEAWRFQHPVVRESLLERAREAGTLPGVHAACAKALAQLQSTPPTTRSLQRQAHHWLASTTPMHALQPGLEASRRLSSAGRLAASQQLVDACDAVLNTDPTLQQQWCAPAASIRAMLAFHKGAIPEAAHQAQQALDLGAQDNHLCLALRLRVLTSLAQRQTDAARQAVGALQTLCDRDDMSEARATGLHTIGQFHVLTGNYEAAIRTLRESAATHRARGHRYRQAYAELLLADALYNGGQFDDAEQVARSNLADLDALGMQSQMAHANNIIGHVHLKRGELPLAIQCFSTGIDLLHTDSPAVLVFRANLVMALLADTQLKRAREVLDEDPLGNAGHSYRTWAFLGIAHACVASREGNASGTIACLDALEEWLGDEPLHPDLVDGLTHIANDWKEHNPKLAERCRKWAAGA